MRVYICGFMGCGKSTLLKSLSKDATVYDLDDVISNTYAVSCDGLGDFIRDKGWEEFRRLEMLTLKSIKDSAPVVISLGGGTLEIDGALEWIMENGELVWLNVDFEECMKRISGDRNRPQLDKSNEELLDLYNQRKSLYSKSKYKLEKQDIAKIASYEDLMVLIGKKLD